MLKRKLLALIATATCLASTGQAAISVGPTGTGVLTFDTAPATTEWSTRDVGGAAGDITAVTGATGLDARVNTNTAATIVTALNSQGAALPNTPNAQRLAIYASAGHYLETRVTGPSYGVLMGTFVNNSGGDLTTAIVTYTLTVYTNVTEEIPGHRVFYSLTGAAQSWIPLPALDGAPTSGSVNKGAALDLSATPWTAGSTLYLLFADDNAGASPDTGYAIDDFSISLSGSLPPIVVTAPVDGLNQPTGVPIVFTAAPSVTGVTSVDFLANGSPLGSDSTSPYSITNSSLAAGTYTITAVAHGSGGDVTSTNRVIITLHPNAPPTIVTVTNGFANSSFLVGSTITNTAVVTDDGAVTNVQFRVDGTTLWNDRTSPFQFAWCDMLAGSHTLTVVATDNSGVSSTTSVPINVTNPPLVDIIMPNGTAWKYLDDGTDQGTAWYGQGFDTSSWSNGVAEIGFGDTDTDRPETTLMRRFYSGSTSRQPTNYYFVKTFTFANRAAYTNIIFNLLRDDGAVVYLNGVELYRENMPAGAVTAGTLASGSQPDDGTQYFQHSVDPATLLDGNNLLAVEVHQNSGTSTDISFDMMIWGQKPGGPILTISRTSPGQGQISWQGANTVLQSNSNLGNPNGWNDINPATYQHPGGDQNLNAVTINLGPGNLFFRTR